MVTWIEYAARGRNAIWRYAVAAPLALLSAIVLGVLLELALRLSGLAPHGLVAQANDPSRPGPFFVSVLTTFALVLAGFVLALRFVHGKRFRDLLGRWRWELFLIGAGAWAAAQVVATAADLAIVPHALRISVSSATLGLAAVAVPALAVQTFTEEVIFRGYVTQGLSLLLRRPLLVSALSGLIFGAVHIENGAPQAVGALLFGMATAYAAIRTGGLAFGAGAHLVNNLFGGLVVVSDADIFKGAPAVFTEHAPRLLWWDVGVEALLLAALVLLVNRLSRPSPAANGREAGLASEPA